jgi:hypothetical protein
MCEAKDAHKNGTEDKILVLPEEVRARQFGRGEDACDCQQQSRVAQKPMAKVEDPAPVIMMKLVSNYLWHYSLIDVHGAP